MIARHARPARADHQLFAALINEAKPGIVYRQAYARGLRFRSELAATGITDDDNFAWCTRLHGRALIVHLDDNGRPHQPKATALLVKHHETDAYLAANPNAVIAATWGVNNA